MAWTDTRTERNVLIALMAAAFLARIALWIYTGRTWEDALITVLHAENFWQGHGLSHIRPDGVPVHGFTSPISVLVPLVGGMIDLNGTYALPFIRLVSAFVGPLTVLLAWLVIRSCVESSAERLSWLIFSCVYLAIEHHQMLWGMAGMETQLVTASVFFAFWACARPTVLRLSAALALALYARPDFAFLNIAVCAYAFFCIDRKTAIQATLLGAAMYFPWILFTTLYYGSPIPNTIFAKLFGYADMAAAPWWIQLQGLWVPLGPSYAGNGSGYYPIFDNGVISLVVAGLFLTGAFFSIRDKVKSLYVPIAFVTVYLLYYIFAVDGVFGWYIVPVSAATVFIAGYGLTRLARLAGERARTVGYAIAALYAISILAVAPMTAKGERDIQNYVEIPVRKAMGDYLGKIMEPGQWVGLEPLGYVGYYSRNLVLDYPGLVNPQVVSINRESGPNGMCAILNRFRPEYMMLRDRECAGDEWRSENYRILDDFGASPEVVDMLMANRNVDLHFTMFQRKDLTPPSIDRNGEELPFRTYEFDEADPEQLAAMVDYESPSLEPAFSAHGTPPVDGLGNPPVDAAVWGSYLPLGDPGQGELSLTFTLPGGATAMAIPVITGPGRVGLPVRFELYGGDHEKIAEIVSLPIPTWRLWRIEVPHSESAREFALHVVDAGQGWGEWAAVGTPYLIEQ